MDGPTVDALRAGLGDRTLAGLIHSFVEGSSGRIEAMRAACARGAEEDLRRDAHSLRGTAASYGAFRLADLCRELEAQGLSAETNALLSSVERELEAMRR